MDTEFEKRIIEDVTNLIKEKNILKRKLESEETRHLKAEAKYHGCVLGICREIERKIPGINLDIVRFELET